MRISDMNWMQVEAYLKRDDRAIALEGFGLTPVLSTQDRHGQPTFTLYRIESDGR